MTAGTDPSAASDLLRGAAHLLRSPLGVIVGLSTTLRDYDHRFTGEQRTMYLGEILQAAQEMSTALDGLSLLARVAGGTLGFAPLSVRLPELARAGAAALNGVWGAGTVAPAALGDGRVWLDPQRANQAIESLARVFTPAAGAALVAMAAPGPRLRLGPLDLQAPGEDVTGMIRQPLHELDAGTLVARPGGWALLLARHLLEAQGASLSIEPAGDGETASPAEDIARGENGVQDAVALPTAAAPVSGGAASDWLEGAGAASGHVTVVIHLPAAGS